MHYGTPSGKSVYYQVIANNNNKYYDHNIGKYSVEQTT